MSFKGFNESWLKAYQAKISEPAELPDVIGFTLREPLRLLNETRRWHHSVLTGYRNSLSAQIAEATDHLPRNAPPMHRARVSITRYSIKKADYDNIVGGGAKQLVDCLLVRSTRHPSGLGFIVDDSDDHVERNIRGEVVAKKGEQRTVVLIERLP